jgi:hypothetical protein
MGFFFEHVTPYLIALNVFDGEVDNESAHDLFAALARYDEQAQDGIPVKIRQALGRADGISLQKHLESHQAPIFVGVHIVKEPFRRLRIDPSALRTLEPLVAVSRAVFAAIQPAGIACH